MIALAQIEAKNHSLRKAELEGIFYLLKNNTSLKNSQLIGMTGLPKETLRDFKASISGLLDVSSGDIICLNPTGKEFVQALNPQPYKWCLRDFNDPSLESWFSGIRDNLKLVPERNFDQFFATVQSSVSKALILKEKGLIENRRIAIIGDDDMVSLILAKIGGYKELVVFDIDSRMLQTIEDLCIKEKLSPIKTVKYDVRNSPDSQYKNHFDVVMTDPPYTKSGFGLFLTRCVELVDNFRQEVFGKYIFIHYGNSFKSPERFIKTQELINRFGLVCEDVISKFARYHGAESIGNSSTLYILRTAPQTSSDNILTPSTIYTYEESKEEKFPYVDHFVLKLNNVPETILNSKKALLRAVGEFCTIHKLNVVKTDIFKFKPFGFSITFILSNSNLLVHTWPEYSAVHIDLITCAPLHKRDLLAQTASNLFETKSVEVRYLE